MTEQHNGKQVVYLILLVLIYLAGTRGAAAQWPANEFVPIPYEVNIFDTDTPISLYSNEAIEGDFGGCIPPNDCRLEYRLKDLDKAALRQGAEVALIRIMNLVSTDVKILEAAGYPAPFIEPLLKVATSGGIETYYPVFWSGGFSAPFRAGGLCASRQDIGSYGILTDTYPKPKNYILANNDDFPYATLFTASKRTDYREYNLYAYMTSQLVHEVVHTIQQADGFDKDCADSPGWVSEGTAEGLAYYLSSVRDPDFFIRNTPFRNARDYSLSLDGRQLSDKQDELTQLNYGTGSFWRYLIEASGRNKGLDLMKDILTIPAKKKAEATSEAFLQDTDRIIKRYAGPNRSLYQVFPEFLTEAASYGAERYTRSTNFDFANGIVWLEQLFSLESSPDSCHQVRLDNTKNFADTTVDLNPISGRCIRVDFTDIKKPVALQIRALGAGQDFSSLHLGESLFVSAKLQESCFGTTKVLTGRIASPMNTKCMLKRQTMKNGNITQYLWTSGTNLEGTGVAYFILSNTAKKITDSKKVSIPLQFGYISVTSPQNNQLTPQSPTLLEKALKNGLTLMDSRISAVAMSHDRFLFDGRDLGIGGKGRAYDPGQGQMADMDTVSTYIRGRPYFINFGWSGPASARPGFSAQLVKNTGSMTALPINLPPECAVETFEKIRNRTNISAACRLYRDFIARVEETQPVYASSSGTTRTLPLVPVAQGNVAGLSGMTLTALEDQPPVERCGYQVTGSLSVIERSAEQLKFRLSGDLFDYGRLVTAGASSASECDLLKSIWIEKVSFEVAVPFGDIYSPDSDIADAELLGSDLYEEEFFPGPNFGGILASQSLINDGPPPDTYFRQLENEAPPVNGPSSDTQPGAGTDVQNCDALIASDDFRNARGREAQMMLVNLQASGCLCEAQEALNDPVSGQGISDEMRTLILQSANLQCSDWEPLVPENGLPGNSGNTQPSSGAGADTVQGLTEEILDLSDNGNCSCDCDVKSALDDRVERLSREVYQAGTAATPLESQSSGALFETAMNAYGACYQKCSAAFASCP